MRKRIVLGIALLCAAVLIGLPTYFVFHRTATCSDALMNGDETGVDCGGGCQRLCTIESLPLVIKGDPRILTIAPGTYEVVALLENPNATAEIRRAQYTVSVYAAGSLVPVKTFTNTAFVPAGEAFAIFEGPFVLEADILPARATLEWSRASLVWEKVALPAVELSIGQSTFSRLETAPRLEATVANGTRRDAANIDLTALIYDAGGTIFAASKTLIPTLGPGQQTQAIFTWPQPFPTSPVEVEVLMRIFPDSTYVR